MIVFGQRFYGAVKKHHAAYIATQFFHVYFLPLIPFRSMVVLSEGEGSTKHGVVIPLHGASVLAGYLRWWGPFALLGTLVSSATSAGPNVPAMLEQTIGTVLLEAAGLAAIVLGWAWVGTLSDTQRKQFEAYALVYGHPVDVALLGEARAPLATLVLQRMVERGPRVAVNYRNIYDPQTQWGLMALDPGMNDRDYLSFALTLARLEGSLRDGQERAAAEELHDKIWQRLEGLQSAAAWTPQPTTNPPQNP